MKNFSGSLTTICLLLATISACSSSKVAMPSQTPDTNQTPSVSPVITSTNTPSKSPTPVLEIKVTPTLIPPLDNWDKRYISRIPTKDMASATPEEIVKSLVTQWLEYYKTQSTDSDFKIEEYSLGWIRLEKTPTTSQYKIVATAAFQVKPVKIPNVWASFPGEARNQNDPWWHLGMTFGVFRDSEYFRLRLLPGWGT